MPSRRRDAVVAVCAPGARDAADAADRSIDRSIVDDGSRSGRESTRAISTRVTARARAVTASARRARERSVEDDARARLNRRGGARSRRGTTGRGEGIRRDASRGDVSSAGRRRGMEDDAECETESTNATSAKDATTLGEVGAVPPLPSEPRPRGRGERGGGGDGARSVPGWLHAAEVGGKIQRERGMRSANNIEGLPLDEFTRDMTSLGQWARVGNGGKRAMGDALRATSFASLESAVVRETWPRGMMDAYLDAQFLRSVEQGKMVQCFTESGDAAWATFHTNLLSYDEFPLFAMFGREFTRIDKSQAVNGGKWELVGFVDDVTLRDPSQPWNAIEPILHVPPRPTFVEDPCDCLWIADETGDDVVLEIDARFWESLESDAVVALLKEFSTLTARHHAGMSAISRLARLVSYGFHAPVPRFARLQGARGPGKVQMLLPFKADSKSMQTRAAVVVDIIKSRRGGRMYRAVGVVSLREAVFTARVIGPLTTSDWLNADAIERSPSISVSPPESENAWDERKDDYPTKVAYATMATKAPAQPADGIQIASPTQPVGKIQIQKTSKPSSASNGTTPAMPTRMKIDDWYKATIADDGPPKIVNPKVNLKMLPFEFMQAVCKKLHLDDSILRLSDAPSESEYRLTQALSTEASGWVRSIMSSYGIIDRVYVGVSRRVRCFFAVVSFEKWTDLEVRNALVSGETIQVAGFRCREKVYMRLSLQDKRSAL
jgi:hypothetical protein